MDYSKNKKAKKIFDEIQYNMYKDRMKLDKNLKPITKSKANYLNKQGYKLTASILKFIPKNKKSKVLDIGIGYGVNSFCIQEIFKHKMYAVEHPERWYITNKFFKTMCKKYQIELKLLDITNKKLPFDTNFFDCVLFTEVIEHIPPYLKKFPLDEIDRVIRPGGTLIISTPNFISLVHRIKFLLGIHVEYDISDEPELSGTYGHVREYTLYELKNILIRRGYQIKNIKMVNYSYNNKFVDFFNNLICGILPFLKNDIVIEAIKKRNNIQTKIKPQKY